MVGAGRPVVWLARRDTGDWPLLVRCGAGSEGDPSEAIGADAEVAGASVLQEGDPEADALLSRG